MNAIKSFFRKYGAVPTNNSGPSWSQASEESLLGWYKDYAAIVESGWNRGANRDATIEERRACLPLYHEIVAEIRTRSARPDASPDIVAAWLRSQLPRVAL